MIMVACSMCRASVQAEHTHRKHSRMRIQGHIHQAHEFHMRRDTRQPETAQTFAAMHIPAFIITVQKHFF